MSDRPKPLIIGLTGSIAMGKSTVGQMFVELGVPLFDADQAVHQLQGPGGALVDEIETAFPGSTTAGAVDRQKLGAMVLGDPAALARLEQLIHPAVAQMRQQFLSDHRDAAMIIFDIPLLFEKAGEKNIDHIVVVSTTADDQKRRALARLGMSEEKFARIIALQMPDSEKRQRADTIIDTSRSLDETRSQVKNCVEKLKASLA